MVRSAPTSSRRACAKQRRCRPIARCSRSSHRTFLVCGLCEQRRRPRCRLVLLSEKTVVSSDLTHGLGTASGPRPHRRHPDRPGQRPHCSRLSIWQGQDTRRRCAAQRPDTQTEGVSQIDKTHTVDA